MFKEFLCVFESSVNVTNIKKKNPVAPHIMQTMFSMFLLQKHLKQTKNIKFSAFT